MGMKIQNFDPTWTGSLGGAGSTVGGNALVESYRDVVFSLTNRSVGVRFPGDLVVIDPTADDSFTTSASCNTLLPVGVLIDQTGVGSNGRVRFGGYAESVAVGSNVTATRGSYLYHSSTTTRANFMFGTQPSPGAFGYVTAEGSNTDVQAYIFPTYGPQGGAGTVSYGSNASRVAEIPYVGVSTDVARTDHIHDGIGTITASSSNTLQRGTWNVRAGDGVALALSDTDGDGEFDTTTIVNTRHVVGGQGTVGASLPLDIPPNSPHAKDDEFTGTTLDGKWTSPGTSASGNEVTNTVQNNWLVMESDDSGTASIARYALFIRQDAPSGSFTISARVTRNYSEAATTGDDCLNGIFVGKTGSGKAHVLGIYGGAGGHMTVRALGITTYSESADWTSYDGHDVQLGISNLHAHARSGHWLKMVYDSGSSVLSYYYSIDGVLWNLAGSRSSVTQPDRIGIVIYNNSQAIRADNRVAADWFRVTEP